MAAESCEKVLKDCDSAVEALLASGEAKNLVISDLTKENALLAKQYSEIKDSANYWYHNPFVVGVLGLAIGVLGGVYVRNR